MRNEFSLGITLFILLFSFQANTQTPCSGGSAAGFPCDNIDLAAYMPLSAIGNPFEVNDIWGWTHAASGREFAIIGIYDGTAFVEITDPNNPVYLGDLPTHTSSSSWRDVKTYNDHAFIVSEANNHGVQVFNLIQLLTVSSPTTFTNTAHYDGIGRSHNIVINETTGFAYAVGGVSGSQSGCSGGLHMIDISNPTSPTFAGCYSLDGYTHDAQCVTYNGPDAAYVGREICFCYNEDTQTIVDVTNKSNPVEISRTGYSGRSYTHQGWLTEDHRYTLLNDEYDEGNRGHNTRTYVMDNQDLDSPMFNGYHESSISAIDHNLYIKGNFVYEANYRGGLRILEMTNLANATMTEVGYFDVYPSSNSANFNGAWSSYPYFPSGTVIVSGIEQGLFVLDPSAAIVGTACTPNAVVDLNTDAKASEIMWTISSTSTSTVVASGDGFANNSNNVESLCLSPGCYRFVITDKGGDGICCSTATSGGYTFSINGVDIRQGGSYASEESFEFCITASNQGFCPINLSDSGTINLDYQVADQITSNGQVLGGSSIDYEANTILMLPPFEVKPQAQFSATINPCSN